MQIAFLVMFIHSDNVGFCRFSLQHTIVSAGTMALIDIVYPGDAISTAVVSAGTMALFDEVCPGDAISIVGHGLLSGVKGHRWQLVLVDTG